MFTLAASMGELPSTAFAQMGTTGMAPPNGGVIGRAVVGLQELNANGPGYGYVGFNGADRGLGYVGSYMTVGAFVPYAQDDLGGFWSADLRGHLSVNGGFFSNVGAVRKQFLGGALLGVGVYWDYDGDSNQYTLSSLGVSSYPNSTAAFGNLGQSYNQVGISTELLTDWGNIRSNGYIPVGRTATTAGNPNFPFYQNFVMCRHGFDAALAGADLELGAYVPGLADWAGMVSVGGYTLGNATNNWSLGPSASLDVVPWFGGVYTRLDMTFLENWDFSLQANNDSYFDWTGFARLTYRLGGSRRRNVPDQMEQPMMRNEHIVRAHQTPLVAVNPSNIGPDGQPAPWRVFHVNNQAGSDGNGMAGSPFETIAEANAAATNPWDIVFVDAGTTVADNRVAYTDTFSPLAANQYFIGNGAPFDIFTQPCGIKDISTISGPRPLLSNPTGPSIVVKNGLVVNNFDIVGSTVGIGASNVNLSSGINRPGESPYASKLGDSVVTNVSIFGTKQAGQTGVFLEKTTGGITFQDVDIADMTNGGLVVEGGNPRVTFEGNITSNVAFTGGFVSPIIAITDTTGGTFDINKPPSSGIVTDIGGDGILIADNKAGTVINIGNVTLIDSVTTGIKVEDSFAAITITDAIIEKETDGAAILVDGGGPTFTYLGEIVNQQGYLLEVIGTISGSVLLDSPPGLPFVDNGSGIVVDTAAGSVEVRRAIIDSDENGIAVFNSPGTQTFKDIVINGAGGPAFAGVNLQSNIGTSNFENLKITTNKATGFLAANDNVINVTGNSTVNSTGAPAVSLSNVADANINFNSVKSTNSSSQGVFINNTNGVFNVAGGVTVTNPTNDGFVVQNSANLEVNVPTLTAVTAAGIDGVKLVNNNQSSGAEMKFGTVNISTGDASKTPPVVGGRGLVIQSTTAKPHGMVTVGGGTVDASGGASLDINNADVDITLQSASSTSSSGNGLNLVNTAGSVQIGKTSAVSPTGNGINAVDNAPGLAADFGTTSVTGIRNGAVGVNLVNATTPSPDTKYSFDSLAVQTVAGTGLLAKNAGTVNFNSPASITAVGGPALNLENTKGTTNGVAGSGFTFLNVASTNSPSNGIRLHNLNSDLAVTGLTTVTNASGESIAITDTQSPPGAYSIDFNTVQISSRNNIGLLVDGIYGQVQVANLQINNTNSVAGDAVLINNTTNPANPTGTGSGRVYIDGGSINNSNGNGIHVIDGVARITGVTVAGSTAQAIYIEAGAGQQSTVLVQNSTLTGPAGIDGIRAESTGSGKVNVTSLTNLVDVAFEPINVIVFNAAGTATVNASGNFGTAGTPPGSGDIVLNNAGSGSLSVTQSSPVALSAVNNGATVSTLGGAVTFGGSTPTPPPPTP